MMEYVSKKTNNESFRFSSAIICLNVYLFKKKPYFQISDHLGGGMDDAHLVEDGGPVIRDSDVPVRRLDHFVHSARSQRRPHCVRNGLRRHDVAENS